MVNQRTGAWPFTLYSNLDFRTFGRTKGFSHLANVLSHDTRQVGSIPRHVQQREEFLWIDFTMPDKLIVDVAYETPFNLDSGLSKNPGLKIQIRNVNVLHT